VFVFQIFFSANLKVIILKNYTLNNTFCLPAAAAAAAADICYLWVSMLPPSFVLRKQQQQQDEEEAETCMVAR
jgi:hypothetical protein